ncbi:hypothetical protein ANO14919_102750 [Xylariales sp. No.14919]|nr:hypothetical protein ANO14919_102750 [Xylariales sp. No.14919]
MAVTGRPSPQDLQDPKAQDGPVKSPLARQLRIHNYITTSSTL